MNFDYNWSSLGIRLLKFQASLLHQPVENTLLFHKLGRTIKLDDLTLVEHYDTIAVEDGVETMSDGDNGAVRKQG